MVTTTGGTNPSPRAPKGLFVAGTDTRVGKTVVTAALAVALRRAGADVGVMKPVETGVVRDGDGDAVTPASDARRLRDLCAPGEDMALLNPYCFPSPVAPIDAARRAHGRIEMPVILDAYRTLAARHEYMIVEGAGGVLVPLTPTEDVRDLIKLTALPCLVVGRAGLGAVNHTRLTLMGLRQAGIPIAGVLLNHTAAAGTNVDATADTTTAADTTAADRDARLQTESTVELIRAFAGAPVFGPLPFQPAMAAHWEDGVNELAGHAAMREVAAMARRAILSDAERH